MSLWLGRSGNHSSRCSARVLAFSLCYTRQFLLQFCCNKCYTGQCLLQLASLRRSKNSADDWYHSAHALKGGVASTVLHCATTKKFVVALHEWELISTSCNADDCGNKKNMRNFCRRVCYTGQIAIFRPTCVVTNGEARCSKNCLVQLRLGLSWWFTTQLFEFFPRLFRFSVLTKDIWLYW